MQAAELLEQEGISLAVVDARFVKPLDRDLLIDEACRTGFLVTVEENALQGGFGSAVLELLAEERLAVKTLRFGVPDCFVEQGSQAQLRQRIGLDCDSLVQRIRGFIGQNEPQRVPVSGAAV
ncbi:MAG: hypothetical protein A2289_10750 [Deltaproteobacteria bacterium RIFOXYA12_FULL_58_15]|nr:MAG: hypothetical protein A2289_10750 [Deltaproteobacteria bacterium RIFOXYA12_FULL_58_15]